MIKHPWHEAPVGRHVPEFVNGIIEISTGMRAKYEVDKETGLLKLDRVLYSSVYYPANYGFIPQTLGEDMDPLDIMILSLVSIQPLCLVPARVIGVMRMVDQGFREQSVGSASAIAVVYFVIVLSISLLQRVLVREERQIS